MKSLIIALFILITIPVLSYGADKEFTAGEALVLTDDISWDNVTSSATTGSWATVTGAYNITVSGDVDISYVSFQNTGTVTIAPDAFGEDLIISYCVFDGPSQVFFGGSSTHLTSDISVTYSDFRNQTGYPAIGLKGASGLPSGLYDFNYNTVTYDYHAYVTFNSRESISFRYNSLYNVTLGDWGAYSCAGNGTYNGNFLSGDTAVMPSAASFFKSNSSYKSNEYLFNYIYADYVNPHIHSVSSSAGEGTTVHHVGNIFESTEDSANMIFTNAYQASRIDRNLIIGEGTLVTHLVSDDADADITNNIMYMTADQTYGLLYMSETNNRTGGTLNITGNTVSTSGFTAASRGVSNNVGGAETITYTGDNQWYNITTPYDTAFTYTSQGSDTIADPSFPDVTRTLSTWSTSKGGSGTKDDAVTELMLMNGYNSTTKKQSDTPSGYASADLVEWVYAGYSTDWDVWLDHSITKPRQDGEDVTSGDQTHSFKMARNEFEAFQVFIYAGTDLTGVDISITDFIKGIDTIDYIHIYKEHYVNCATESREEYKIGYYPDALLPKVDIFYGETRTTFPFTMASGNIQGVWVEVGTETTTVAGTYTATVTIAATGKTSIELPITLEVFDFALPSTASYPATYNAGLESINRAHGYEWDFDNVTGIELLQQYADMHVYHRTVMKPLGDPYSTGYTWDDVGKVLTITDFDPWDEISVGALEGSTITSGPYSGGKMKIGYVSRTNQTNDDATIINADKQTAYRQYLQQSYDQYDTNGLDPFTRLYVNTTDEPRCTVYVDFRGNNITQCEVVKLEGADVNSTDTDGAGTWKNVYIHTYQDRAGITDFADYGFYSPNFYSYACPSWNKTCSGEDPSTRRSEYTGYPEDQNWPYLACDNNGCYTIGSEAVSGQIDSSADAPAMYNRLTGFNMWKYEATGTYYWSSTAVIHEDPYYSIESFGSNGDGLLLYPGIATRSGRTWDSGNGDNTPAIGGTHDIPIASMRWKYIRDWQEDMEYMKLAEASSSPGEVDTIVDTMFTDTDTDVAYWNLNMSVDDLLTAREDIADLISGSGSNSGVLGVGPGTIQSGAFSGSFSIQ